jgi:hypothetical protein
MLWECQTLWDESQRGVAAGAGAGRSNATDGVRVRCRSGARTVYLSLPVTWEDTLSDGDLMVAIASELERGG